MLWHDMTWKMVKKRAKTAKNGRKRKKKNCMVRYQRAHVSNTCLKYVKNMFKICMSYIYIHISTCAPQGHHVEGQYFQGCIKLSGFWFACKGGEGEEYSTWYTLELFYCHLTELGRQMFCKCNTPAYPFLTPPPDWTEKKIKN